MSSSNFNETSYRLHSEIFKPGNKDRQEIQQTWFRTDTVDFWRTMRMYELVSPIVKSYPGATWLTVGDGRYGFDSIRLKKLESSIDVLPTDISPYLLQEAFEKGMINKYSVENAEHLSFSDNEFDFVFCKDSYHHFPRPYIAVYEMLRVAKKGIVLLEPNEKQPFPFIPQMIGRFKNFIKKIIGKKIHHADTWNFEEAGNYIYSVSKREIQKVALGMQLPSVMFAYINDTYLDGAAFEKMSDDSILFNRTKRSIKRKDLKCRMGLSRYEHILAVIMKEPPSETLVKSLRDKGFDIEILPQNPYLPK